MQIYTCKWTVRGMPISPLLPTELSYWGGGGGGGGGNSVSNMLPLVPVHDMSVHQCRIVTLVEQVANCC